MEPIPSILAFCFDCCLFCFYPRMFLLFPSVHKCSHCRTYVKHTKSRQIASPSVGWSLVERDGSNGSPGRYSHTSVPREAEAGNIDDGRGGIRLPARPPLRCYGCIRDPLRNRHRVSALAPQPLRASTKSGFDSLTPERIDATKPRGSIGCRGYVSI